MYFFYKLYVFIINVYYKLFHKFVIINYLKNHLSERMSSNSIVFYYIGIKNWKRIFIATSILNKIVINVFLIDISLSLIVSNFILKFQIFFNEGKQNKN